MPPPSTSKIKRVSITPTPGLVVKVRRTDGRGPAKVFLNIAYDAHVPRPPSVSPDTVKAALTGGPSGNYSVPLIVSDARNARDKGITVVDVVFSPDIGTWMKDADFQRFIIELSLQRAEERHNMKFDRDTLAFPNIRSKGPLEARDVLLPSTDGGDVSATSSKSLIEEIPSASTVRTPKWRWTQDADSGALQIVVDVPALTRALYAQTALDLEPRRLLLETTGLYALDVPLDTLPRAIDVDSASAEWRVGAGQLVISV
ncbi:hypothetical protein EXIGLDRAFT_776392 [Exidia glandulosa HHB12029]|uniref:PIH1 N-terminal domain-containing protein n=1 Tax=Exidia glandulosa HHB12029 TaxID=1314781 RepID=A0A165DHS5_EXIGL|nr:hypothetical protein EXIGLDRAFT_776392 [Exidia glandulosa HHB12029]